MDLLLLKILTNVRIVIMKMIVFIFIIVVFSRTYYDLSASNNSFTKNILNKSGVAIKNSPKELSDEYARKIINILLPQKDIKIITPSNARTGKARSILFDYGKNGKSLSFQKCLNLGILNSVMLDILIDRIDGVKLRHKIKIGTDMSNWELIKKDTSYPNDNPFQRTYVLVQARGKIGRMVGLIFFEGSIVTIDIDGPVNSKTINNLKDVTWRVSKRLKKIYNTYLKYISEGQLFKDNPIITRKDLPDPDIK